MHYDNFIFWIFYSYIVETDYIPTVHIYIKPPELLDITFSSTSVKKWLQLFRELTQYTGQINSRQVLVHLNSYKFTTIQLMRSTCLNHIIGESHLTACGTYPSTKQQQQKTISTKKIITVKKYVSKTRISIHTQCIYVSSNLARTNWDTINIQRKTWNCTML